MEEMAAAVKLAIVKAIFESGGAIKPLGVDPNDKTAYLDGVHPIADKAATAAIEAAFPHAKPISEIERGVIERLADEADECDLLACATVDGVRTGPKLSDWLRSQIKEGE